MAANQVVVSNQGCAYGDTRATSTGSRWLVPYVNQRRYCMVSFPGAVCGRCYEVVYDGVALVGSCPGKQIIQVVQQFASTSAQFSCFTDTYANITGVQSSVEVPIRYRPVNCAVTGPSAVVVDSVSWNDILFSGGHTAIQSVRMRAGNAAVGMSRLGQSAVFYTSTGSVPSVTNKTVAFDITYADSMTYTLSCFNHWPVPMGTQCHAL